MREKSNAIIPQNICCQTTHNMKRGTIATLSQENIQDRSSVGVHNRYGFRE